MLNHTACKAYQKTKGEACQEMSHLQVPTFQPATMQGPPDQAEADASPFRSYNYLKERMEFAIRILASKPRRCFMYTRQLFFTFSRGQ